MTLTENHVHKEGHSEDNHGNKLVQKVQCVSKVNGVETLKTGTGEHLNDTKDHTQLHLKRVEKQKLVGGHVPDWIQSKWVN